MHPLAFYCQSGQPPVLSGNCLQCGQPGNRQLFQNNICASCAALARARRLPCLGQRAALRLPLFAEPVVEEDGITARVRDETSMKWRAKKMSETTTRITDFVRVLGDAGPEDLVQLDQDINRLKQHLNSLQVLRKVLAARIVAVPELKKPETRPEPKLASNGKSTAAKPVKSATMWERRRQLIAEICVRGPLRYGEIEKILKISSGGVLYSVINYPAWFIKENDRWNITNEARQELAKVRVGQNEEESE